MSETDLKLDWDAVEIEGDGDPAPQDNSVHGENVDEEMDEGES